MFLNLISAYICYRDINRNYQHEEIIYILGFIHAVCGVVRNI